MRKTFILFGLFFFCSFVLAISQEDKERDRWQQPEKIMDVVGVEEGMRIGEAGAGSGYFTFKLSERVGPDGIIYANDIDKDELKKLKSKARDQHIENIQFIIGLNNDPLFPDSLDMVIMVYVFHHLDEPIPFLHNVSKSLKPDASVILVERDPEKHSRAKGHFLEKDKILAKIKEADYDLVKIETFLERDNIYIIKPATKM